MRAARLPVAALLLGTFLAMSPAAWALTRTKADAAALAILRPQKAGPFAVVYGYPRALPAGTTVSAAGPAPGQRWRVVRTSSGIELTARVPRTTLKAPGWLFWEDAHAGAEFPHPSRLLLLDGATGKPVWTKTIDWYPLVNDKTAAFLRSYRNRSYRIFAAGAPVTHALRLPQAAAAALAAPTYSDACLVTVNDPSHAYDGANFAGDAEALLKVANDFGFGGTNRTGTAGSAAELEAEVARLVKNGCKDVVVLVAGHGAPAEGDGATAKPTVVVESHVAPTPDGAGETVVDQAITLPDLEALVSKIDGPEPKVQEGQPKPKPKVEFKFVIDSCFSGRFAVDQFAHQYGVRWVGTSAQANQLSVMWAAGDDTSDHADGATQYVSDLTTGFRTIVNGEDPNIDQQTLQAARSDLVVALSLAAEYAADKAGKRGRNNPVVVENTPSPPPVLESEYSFSGLTVSFSRPAGLYGQDVGTTTETFAGTACGHSPLEAPWTITATNSYSPEGVVHPPITAIVDFSKTNPSPIDPMELITNPGGTAIPNGTIVATGTTTIALNEPALTMEISISVTGEFTAAQGSGSSVPITATLLPKPELPKVKSCP